MSRLSGFTRIVLLATGFANIAAATAFAEPLYNVTNLGYTVARDLSNSGTVVGRSWTPGNPGFVYNAYGPNAGIYYNTPDDVTPKAVNSSGVMVNDSGYIRQNPDGSFYGEPSAAIAGGYVQQINDAGQILIHSLDYPYQPVVVNSDGSRASLGLGLNQHADGQGINSSGQLVGSAGFGIGPDHAFLSSGGVVHDLGTLPGDNMSAATAINDPGQVVGYSFNTNGIVSFRAFLYSGGMMKEVGTLGGSHSKALRINDAGDIVGDSTTADGQWHAFLYRNGKMHDLIRFLPDKFANFSRYEVVDMNDAGQILLLAHNENEPWRSLLLSPLDLPIPATPVPEPSTLAVFGAVIVTLGVFPRGQRPRGWQWPGT